MSENALVVQELTPGVFGKYGRFASMTNPAPDSLELAGGVNGIRFYPELGGNLLLGPMASNVVSIGACIVGSRPSEITENEYHSFTQEAIMPLNGDVVIHVGLPTGDGGPPDTFEVFRVPQHTIVILDAGVMHHAPHAIGMDPVSSMILLPNRTYINDSRAVNACTVKFEG